MKKRWLWTLVLLGLLPAAAASAEEAWPAKPVRLVVPQAAGSGVDLTTRLLADRLSRLLGQPFIVDNRPGAGGAIASENAAHSPADGYTFLMATSAPLVLNGFLSKNLRYDPARDFSAVAKVIASPFAIVVNKNVPFTTVEGLIAYDRSHPGTLSFASDGTKNFGGLTGEMFNRMAGTSLLQVPYNSTARALTDTMAGETQVSFLSPNLALESVKKGNLRMLGVTTERVDFLQDVPSISETVPGFSVTGWIMLMAPKATPRPIIQRLNAVVDAIQHEDAWMAEQRKVNGGMVKEAGKPAELDAFLVAERAKWGGLIKTLGILPE
jgi:tripartite-type tricarboxylate transporter receptor subunit TctC